MESNASPVQQSKQEPNSVLIQMDLLQNAQNMEIQSKKPRTRQGQMDSDGFAVNVLMKGLEGIVLKRQVSLASQQSESLRISFRGKHALEDGHS